MSDEKKVTMRESSSKRHIFKIEPQKSFVARRKILKKNISNSRRTIRNDTTDRNIVYCKYINEEAQVQQDSTQNEFELASVMTRSAAQKYKRFGAIHNKVNFEHELKVKKRWSPNVSYPLPEVRDDHTVLKEAVNLAFMEVMSYCKCVLSFNTKNSTEPEDLGESVSTIDLSPYLTQEPIIMNGNNESQITHFLNKDWLPQHYINIIPFNEGRNGPLFIQDNKEDKKMVNEFNHRNRQFIENNHISVSNSLYPNVNHSNCLNVGPRNPMLVVHHDHTYADKYINPINSPSPSESSDKSSVMSGDFNMELVLKDLLMNTAILKCIICGNHPEEIVSCIDNAKSDVDSNSMFYSF